MDELWLLLIYAVPSHPSRKRTYVWRELKKLGSVYLRDGVALLPQRAELRERLEAIAGRIVEEEGTAEIIVAPQFLGESSESLRARFQHERYEEYRELHHACVRFLRDVLHEVDIEDFGFPDVANLEGELARLHRWFEQVRARDYFGAPGADRVADILAKCDLSFDRFSSEASDLEESGERRPEDVFDRLGGQAAARPVPDDYPL